MGRAPARGTIEAFLALMGRFGDSTGAAVSRVRVTDRVDEDRFAERDVIVLGDTSLVRSSGLFEKTPLSIRDGRMVLETPSPLEQVFASLATTRNHVQLVAGYYALRLDFRNEVGPARLRVTWGEGMDQPSQVLAAPALQHTAEPP